MTRTHKHLRAHILRVATGVGPFTATDLYNWLWEGGCPRIYIPSKSALACYLTSMEEVVSYGRQGPITFYEIPTGVAL